MEELFELLASSIFVKLVVITVMLDSFLGIGRAIKEGKFNSCIGINGAIRKVAMLVCIVFLTLIDMCVNINLLFAIPSQYIEILGVNKVGICEFFSILFILYECISILKNMLLCGLPVPKWLQKTAENLLNTMTNELEYKDLEKMEGK